MEKAKPRLLVVDDEANIRSLLRLTFEEEFEVEEAEDGMDGFARAVARPPDLIISDIMMPRLDGYGLYRRLRARAETSGIPFMFLSAKREVDEKVMGLEMGADDYLTKPFSTRELRAKAHSLLRKAREVRAGGGLSGRLAEVDISEVLQLLEMGRKTGVLTLKSAGATGQFAFRHGEVVHASLGPWSGAEAYFSLLTWKQGEFSFSQQTVEVEENLHGRGQELLMEGIRLLDEMTEALRRLPSPDTRVSPAPAPPDDLPPLPPNLAAAFAGGATLRAALAASGLPPVRYWPRVADALAAGLLVAEGSAPGRRDAIARARRALMEL